MNLRRNSCASQTPNPTKLGSNLTWDDLKHFQISVSRDKPTPPKYKAQDSWPHDERHILFGEKDTRKLSYCDRQHIMDESDSDGETSKNCSKSVGKDALAFECDFKNCHYSFSTMHALKKHKLKSPNHDYCDICNVNFPTWEFLLEHKLTHPAHRAERGRICRLCCAQFKSETRCHSHIEISHPLNHELVCWGCHNTFTGPVDFIAHLEGEECSIISRKDFLGRILHKKVLKMIFSNPESMRLPKLKSTQDLSIKLHPVSGQTDILTKVTSNARAPNTTYEGKHFASVHDWEYKLCGYSFVEATNCESISSRVTYEPGMEENHKTNYSEPSCENIDKGNMFRVNFWDPNHVLFDPEAFYHVEERAYLCPQAFCYVKVDDGTKLKKHIHDKHILSRIQCPVCRKNFKMYSGLIAHATQPGGKCMLRHMENFNQEFNQLTGGFLSVYKDVRPLSQGGNGSMLVTRYKIDKPVDWDIDFRGKLNRSKNEPSNE